MPDEVTIQPMHSIDPDQCSGQPSETSFATRFGCGTRQWMHAVLRYLLRVLVIYIAALLSLVVSAFAEERPASPTIQEEAWAIPVMLATIACVARPVGDGPLPLVVINHGVSLNQREQRKACAGGRQDHHRSRNAISNPLCLVPDQYRHRIRSGRAAAAQGNAGRQEPSAGSC